VTDSLDGADLAVDGLDEAQAALDAAVTNAIALITALGDDNADLRQQHQAEGGGGAQVGGRRGGRRRRRGGYTPDPCHKRCCGTGTRFSKKRKKCVSRKRGKRRSRRRHR